MDNVLLTAWVASVPGIGPLRFAQLRERVPDVSAFLSLTASQFVSLGIPARLSSAIIAQRTRHPPQEIKTYCDAHDVDILTREDQRYSRLLLEISDPPIVLYMKGEMPDPRYPPIAVVGTRQITPYGREVTQKFVCELVTAQCVIVSGFMYGVDAVAHTTAMDCGGRTIGVLGFGFEYMYPQEHLKLADRMIETGNCLLSEFPPWQKPVPGNFPARNRIVSGLSLGVLVTEAAAKSGSKITARCAADQGREVFAVPGPISSSFSEGTKDLINMGAKLVTSAADIVEEIQFE